MAINIAPFPLRTSVTDGIGNFLTRPWVAWLTDLVAQVDTNPTLVSDVALASKSASVSVTTFPRAVSPLGLYRVGYFARIVRAATTSSSLTLAIGGVNGGVTCAFTEAAMTGNTTTTAQSGFIYIQSDASKPITYTLTYASSGGTTMQYSVWMTIERVSA
jgi:hypothetical protein